MDVTVVSSADGDRAMMPRVAGLGARWERKRLLGLTA